MVAPEILRVVEFTAMQALASTLLSAIIALPLGLWIGQSSRRERGVCEFFLALPFSVPTVVAAMAWVIWLGRNGWLAQLGLHLEWAYSYKAVVLAHVVFNVPWIALWVAQSRAFISEPLLEAARSLGANPLSRFRWVLWPQVKWSFLSAASQTFIFCVMSFALILILGGGPPVSTLETEIYSKIRFGTLDISGAIICALWEMLLTLLPWMIVIYLQGSSDFDRESEKQFKVAQVSAAEAYDRKTTFFATFISWRVISCAFLAFPYFAVVFANIRAVFRTFFFDAAIWRVVLDAFRVSGLLAFWTCVIAVSTAIAAVIFLEELHGSLKQNIGILMGLPSSISVLVLGMGVWLAYDRWIDPFSGSLIAIVFLQGTIFFPIAFKIFWPVVRDRPQRLLEVARSLGATELQVFRTVEWPRWRFPLLSSIGMIFAASMGEVAAISLFYNERLIPVPLLIARWLNQYHFEQAQAVSALLMVVCVGVVGLCSLLKRASL